jgi:integrase
VLSDDDQEMVVAACASGAVSARDAAITLLALAAGLRACDIIALRLAGAGWRGYVLGERPGSAGDHVFLRSVAPHVRLADHASVHRVITETFRKAGATDVKAGTRFLRHNAASRLLRAAVPLPTISAVLGHASQESASVYMSVDRERLLDCVLPVPAGARS